MVRMLCRRSASLMIEHAEVACHRHEHLAHRGGLLRLLRVEVDALELGDAVDDGRHLGTEPRLDVGDGHLGVLDRVVQERRREGDLVEPDLGDDPGHGDRMVDVASPLERR